MRPHLALVKMATGELRIAEKRSALKQIGAVNGGRAAHAMGVAHTWSSETARKAALKRWKRKPMTRLGYRKGQRLRNQLKRVARPALRERYALNPTRGVQYSPALRVWVITDAHGTRTIGERAALIRLGHLSRPHDRPVAEEIILL